MAHHHIMDNCFIEMKSGKKWFLIGNLQCKDLIGLMTLSDIEALQTFFCLPKINQRTKNMTEDSGT